MLERCVLLASEEGEMNSRRFSRLMNDLSYACALGDEAGVQNGWIKEDAESFSLVFAISTGDVVFTKLRESLGSDPFVGEPIASSNSWVLARAINEILSQEKNSSLRRSTRIPADVRLKLEGEGFACTGETVTVNLHGALVRSTAPLKLGDLVTLRVMRTGRSASGAVVFANISSRQFGIELQHPENIWGITSPPPDWNVSLSH